MKMPEIKEYLRSEMEKYKTENIASTTEILEYLTGVLRGKSESEEIVVVNIGCGKSRPEKIMRTPTEKERLDAAKMLGKRYGLFNEKIDISGEVGVTIVDDMTKV